MSLLFTPGQNTVAKTASYTVLTTDDIVQFTISAAVTATLPSTNGLYAGQLLSNRLSGQGKVLIKNVATSTANVTIAAGSGDAIFGNTSIAPGQAVLCESDGGGTWYCSPAGTGAGSGVLQAAVIPVSSAQWLTFRTTPVVLAAAPGSGKCNIVERISLKMITTATQYTSGGALEFRYTDVSGTKVSADIAAAVVTTTAGTSFTTVGGIEASLTGTTNAAVVATCATADFATGTGTGVFTCLYYVQN
jgi:hypothetical protein